MNPIPQTDDNDYFDDCFDDTHYQNATLYVPQEALKAYQTAEMWKEFKNIVGINLTGIANVNVADKNTEEVYYDINGRRLNAPIKGLNIVNGKKLMMK